MLERGGGRGREGRQGREGVGKEGGERGGREGRWEGESSALLPLPSILCNDVGMLHHIKQGCTKRCMERKDIHPRQPGHRGDLFKTFMEEIYVNYMYM